MSLASHHGDANLNLAIKLSLGTNLQPNTVVSAILSVPEENDSHLSLLAPTSNRAT